MDENKTVTIAEKVSMNIANIEIALDDYGRYTDGEVLEDVSREFIENVAIKNAYKKNGLRELFRKSPAWNEELDCLVINGSRTHDPDALIIKELAYEILRKPLSEREDYNTIRKAIRFFWNTIASDHDTETYLNALNTLAPKAYAPGKKMSRVFKGLCDALGVTDDTAGSEFQRLYAQIADEMNGKQINFKLFVSVNPAHFITMSNPKRDSRGTTLTSCHSFNSTEYTYNNGCSGYACDPYAIIAFTTDNPSDPETLNNRKTMRQIFAYKPGSGVLLQSRLYNTAGGTHGAQKESIVYRDLIQREISYCEGAVNLWNTKTYCKQTDICFEVGDGFGGYPDWTFSDFDAKVSVRADCTEPEGYDIGTYGVCVVCGATTSNGVYCEDCEDTGKTYCYECEELFRDDDLYTVYRRGIERQVCRGCRDEYYVECHECGDWHNIDDLTEVDGYYICEDCLDRYYVQCAVCGDYVRSDDANTALDSNGYEIWVCDYCAEREFARCDDCDRLVPADTIQDAWNEDGCGISVCSECANNYVECESCGRLYSPEYMVGEMCRDCAETESKNENENMVTVNNEEVA